MDDGNSRRSLSPYHEKCFPPYCDNAHQVDKAMVSKMPRGDLEDKYIIFADENLELKKQNRNQERQIQRLQTAIQRQDKMDKRQGVTPASRVADGNLVAILEAQNKNLQAKIKVLKQQLMNHSFIHSKEGRINDSKMRQGLAKTPRESEFQLPSETQSAREAKPDKQVAALKMRIKELEVQLETQKNKHKAQIAQMEKELSALEKEAAKSGTSVNEQLSETSRQVKDNTELIRLRMQAERDAAELAGLQERLRAAGDETDKLQAELQQARDRADDLEKQLDKERNRSRSAVSEASKGTTHMETIRALEEQIRDLQKERDTLKDTNEKLLQLTQTKSEKSLKTASGHSLQISQLENSLKDKMEELEQKEARIKELEQQLEDAEKAREEAVKLAQKPSESGSSKKECSNCEDLSKQLTGSLLDNAKLKALLNEAQKPKTPFPTPEGSGTELNKLKDEVERLQEEADRLRNEADQLRDEVRQLQNEVDQLQGEIEALKDERSNLEHQLSQAHDELDTMRPIVAEHQNCRKSPLPSTSSHDEALRKQNQRLEDELNRAWQELNVLRPIVEEHRNCQRPLDVQTSSKAIQVPPTTSFVSFRVEPQYSGFRVEPEPPVEQLISEHYLAPSEESVHSKKTIDSERYIALSRQLQEALYENDRLKKELEGRDGDDALRRQNQRLEDELNRALMELREVRPIADEHTRVCGHPRKEYIVPEYAKSYVGEYLEPEYAKEYQPQSKEPSVRQVSPAQSYASRVKKERRKQKWPDAKSVITSAIKEEKEEIQFESLRRTNLNNSKEDEYLMSEKNVLIEKHEELDSTFKDESTTDINNLNSKREDLKAELTNCDLKEVKGKFMLKNTESLGREKSDALGNDLEESKPKSKTLSNPVEDFKERIPVKETNILKDNSSTGSTSQLENLVEKSNSQPLTPTIVNVKRLLRRRTTLRPSTLPQSPEKSPSTVKKEEEEEEEEESRRGTLRPKLEVVNVAMPDYVSRANMRGPEPTSFRREERSLSNELSVWHYDQLSLAMSEDGTRAKEPLIKAPQHQEHISHVTPPPSVHCVETVNLNDLAQKANLIIVSKHDFEKVLMQKKRYSTEVEVVEPVNERQTLNCKLEICMYDLDIDDRMLEYLSSMQPEPKVYVEWSFVGLDQRTAPLPAEQALFYTNVMYYGPLSSEIKGYLNKVEMPVDLYLVKSSGSPVKVAEGTLDMLPAMEQPNRGFMRSVFMRGKDLPSRYYSDKPVATIHCSFILHECCLGDPPFRDQLEVAIGTLYLKNRDGGVVPDHATHIYIEYALLGHCGPDLETDSVPRGEVMKFNHTKKLRVNEENAPHLKAMLADSNPRPLRFTVLAEPCSLTSDTEVETVGHADINLNEEMIRKDRDLISSQVPVFSNEGEHLGTLSVTVLGIGTLQEVYTDRLQPTR